MEISRLRKQAAQKIKKINRLVAFSTVLALAAGSWLLLDRLGSLTGGLSAGEAQTAVTPVGWHGMYHHPLYLPLLIVRSIVFFIWPQHGQTLTRLPNVLFGAMAIAAFVWLVRLWHGNRTAIFAGLLFASSSWTLHVSRLASFDVLYLWGIVMLLLTHVLLERYGDRPGVSYVCLAIWGLLLYVPGFIWLLLVNLIFQRESIQATWHESNLKHRIGYGLLAAIWLPLLIIDLQRSGQLLAWLGAPAQWPPFSTLLKQLGGVPVHLFIRGPEYANLWVGRAPLMDVFSLAMAVIGIYFYATHLNAQRSRLLSGLTIVGALLVALGGSVSLGVLTPLVFVATAAGLAYFLREWLQTFPYNPLARSVGITLLSLAVLVSCWYNLQAYFVAWPHNPTTVSVFHYHR